MKPFEYVKCKAFPCSDINKGGYLMPAVEVDPEKVKVVMISDAPPEDPLD